MYPCLAHLVHQYVEDQLQSKDMTFKHDGRHLAYAEVEGRVRRRPHASPDWN